MSPKYRSSSLRRAISLAALVLVEIATARANAQQPAIDVAPIIPLVFDGVTVVDVEHGTLRPAQRVVIRGPRVQAIGAATAVKLPKGAQIVDARGKYLIPGLWDMHVHVWQSPRVFYPLFIANGVTGVRDMSSPLPLDSLHRWSREIMTGVRVGPRIVSTGPALHGGDGIRSGLDSNQKNFLYINTPAEGRRAVDSLQAAGADFIKIYAGMSRETYFAVLTEARRIGIPVVGHLNQTITPAEASDSGQRTLEHVVRSIPFCQDLAACQSMAATFIRNRTWVTPTLVVIAMADGALPPHPKRLRYFTHPVISDGQVLQERLSQSASSVINGDSSAWIDDGASPDWATEREYMRLMHQAGVPLLAGTDANPLYSSMTAGFTLHEELRMMVKAGELTPLQALQAATLNPATYLGATDSLGTVAPGKLADLVLLNANPLAAIENTARIRAVVANGRFFDRPALDTLLVRAEQAAAEARAVRPGH